MTAPLPLRRLRARINRRAALVHVLTLLEQTLNWVVRPPASPRSRPPPPPPPLHVALPVQVGSAWTGFVVSITSLALYPTLAKTLKARLPPLAPSSPPNPAPLTLCRSSPPAPSPTPALPVLRTLSPSCASHPSSTFAGRRRTLPPPSSSPSSLWLGSSSPHHRSRPGVAAAPAKAET